MQIGWLAMIPSLVGIPAIIFTGWNTDRTDTYKSHLIVCLIIAILGFIGCGFVTTPLSMVAMLTITSAGLYGFTGCFFAYMTFFFTESTAPVGIALVNSFAALGGFVGPMILGSLTLTSGMLLIAFLLFAGLLTLLSLKQVRDNSVVEIGALEID